MPHMRGVSGFVAQGAPIRQALGAVDPLIRPKAARHRTMRLPLPAYCLLFGANLTDCASVNQDHGPVMYAPVRHTNQAV